MPIITVKVAPRRPDANLEAKVASIAVDAASSILHKRPEVTAVVVERLDPSAWFAGGRSLADQGKASFWLDIKVVDGTNTKDEKQAFLAAIFARMGDLLGDLHPESYVYVNEVAGDAYGFGGVTQEARYVAGKLGVEPVPRPQ
jgi:4-oxalocrotonate tautomerase